MWQPVPIHEVGLGGWKCPSSTPPTSWRAPVHPQLLQPVQASPHGPHPGGWSQAVPFLHSRALSNVMALDVNKAQYAHLPTETGGAVDDAYLYRFEEDRYLLVVNAANTEGPGICSTTSEL